MNEIQITDTDDHLVFQNIILVAGRYDSHSTKSVAGEEKSKIQWISFDDTRGNNRLLTRIVTRSCGSEYESTAKFSAFVNDCAT